ncbi:hypothetical protein CEQ90_13840 [Lewinellaceae bacterium SD302]|nr:hypothetical protein CEQ90_13840 [Lewinellaceae bacterium SD302]
MMNAMPNTMLIYDDACPMCKGYTRAFKHLKWSDRRAFSELPAEFLDKLDLDRARHEIPLLDLESGEVRYGLDSQIAVLSKGLPILAPVLKWPIIKFALMPVYGLITYNRRIIAGTRPPARGFDCAPDFHLPWRIAYLCIAGAAILLAGTLPLLLIAAALGIFFLAASRSTEPFSLAGNAITVTLLGATLAFFLPDLLVGVIIGIELYRRFA